MMTREKYLSLKLDVLRVIARDRGITGGSKMRKAELIDRMLQLDAAEGLGPGNAGRDGGENLSGKSGTAAEGEMTARAAAGNEVEAQSSAPAAGENNSGQSAAELKRVSPDLAADAAAGEDNSGQSAAELKRVSPDLAADAASDASRTEAENAPTAKDVPKKGTRTRASKNGEAARSSDRNIRKGSFAAETSGDNGENPKKTRKPVKSRQAEADAVRTKRPAGPEAGEAAAGRTKKSARTDAAEAGAGRAKKSAGPEAGEAAAGRAKKSARTDAGEAAIDRAKRSAGPETGEAAAGRTKKPARTEAAEAAVGRTKRSAGQDAGEAAAGRTKRSAGPRKRVRLAGGKLKEPVRANTEVSAVMPAEPEGRDRAEPTAAGTAELEKSSRPASSKAVRMQSREFDSESAGFGVTRSLQFDTADRTAPGADRPDQTAEGRPEAVSKPSEAVNDIKDDPEMVKGRAAAAIGGKERAAFPAPGAASLRKERTEGAAAPRQSLVEGTGDTMRQTPGPEKSLAPQQEIKTESVGGFRKDAGPEPVGGFRKDAGPEPVGGFRKDAGPEPVGGFRKDAGPEPGALSRGEAGAEPVALSREEVSAVPDGGPRKAAGSVPGSVSGQETKEQAGASARQETKEQAGASARQDVKEQAGASARQDAKDQPGASAPQEAKAEFDAASRQESKEDANTPSRQEDTDRSAPRQLYYPENASKARGVLELHPDGYGFLRSGKFQLGEEDVYVSPSQIRRFCLRTGDVIEGIKRENGTGDKNAALLFVSTVNGFKPDQARRRPSFESMTPVFPYERIRLEQPGGSTATRVVDLISPIGKGQRGMIVSPPKAGKTTLLKDIAKSILTGDPDAHLLILLVDERPEEVTDMRESVMGTNVEIIYSTFDEQPEHHMRVAEMVIERAKRLVEHHEDVIILLDSITRLTRAYNLLVPPSGRTLSGGLDPAALYAPKRFFGAARKMREGGSLTILATALVDTGSKMDDVVYEEFKGTGNMELILDRKLQERRIFPAIDITKSGTRREDLLLTPDELRAVYLMRRRMNGAKPEDAIENILNAFARSRSNDQVVESVLAKWE